MSARSTTEALEIIAAKLLRGRRLCMASSSTLVALQDGSTARGAIFCRLETGHPLPHDDTMGHTWPTREEIVRGAR